MQEMEVFGVKVPVLTAKEVLTFLVFLALLSLTFRETSLYFQRYFDFPKYTSFQLVYQDDADFPALTFCPIEDDAYRVQKLEVIVLPNYSCMKA